MSAYILTGGQSLAGTIQTPGSKNAFFPLLAASLLWDRPYRLTNIPDIRDVQPMLTIFRSLGISLKNNSDHKETLEIEIPKLVEPTIPADAERLRGAVVLVGPLLARFGRVFLPHPGGDRIGRRPIDIHIRAFQAMGAHVTTTDAGYSFEASRLTGADIYLEKASVTGSESLLLAGVLAYGTTILRHAAQEPHVVALAQTLVRAGAKIEGIGTSCLIITGRSGQLFEDEIKVQIPPDELDAATMTLAGLLTKGSVQIIDYPSAALRPFSEKIWQIAGPAALKLDEARQLASVEPAEFTSFQLLTGYFPAFPSDLQAPMSVVATQAHGESSIHDWVYDHRFGYVDDLKKFGAQIESIDQHQIRIHGPTKLTAARILSPDIRAGMTYILAALIAPGESRIEQAEIIDRGYAHLVERLQGIGAQIQRVEDKD